MGQEQYGAWAAGLDQTTVAKALLAFGIVAADDPSFALGAEAELSRRLLRVLDAVEDANRERRFSRHLPVRWTDPLAMPEWDAHSVAARASQWAAAWDAADRYVRIAMSVGETTDLVWLTGSFRLLGNRYLGGAVSFQARPATPWRFPLRIGLLPDGDGRALYAELVTGFETSSWRATLIDPFLLSPARVSCDILVLSDDPWTVPTRLLTLPGVRAGAVMVTGPGVESGLNIGVIEKITGVSGSWAVGFADVPDVPTWIVELVAELSHALPLDIAFEGVTRNVASVLAADSSVNVRETVDQRATRLAQTLNLAAPTSALAREIVSVVEHGEFISEAGDASDITRLEALAGDIVDEASSGRRLQARISPADRPDVSLTAFQPATDHRIEVRIGPIQDAQWLATAEVFPEDQLEPDRPHELTVVLTEPHLIPVPQVATIELPVVGTSTSAVFALTTLADTVTVDARLIVLSGNRVLQTARLPAEVGGQPPDNARMPELATVAEPEVVTAPLTTAIADRRGFGAAFVVNQNADGHRGATSIVDSQAGLVNLDSGTVKGALEKISDRLNEIVKAPNDFGTIDSDASVELLVFLAFHGAKMRSALVKDSPGLAEVLKKKPPIGLQVVSAKPDAYFPFELAYDFPTPRPGAKLCGGAVAALRSAEPSALCAAEHTREVVCPTGFWGLHRVIERHLYQPSSRVTGSFLLRSAPTRARNAIKLGSAMFAASGRVDEVVPGGIEAVANALAAVGPHTQVSLWSEWRTATAASPAPALLLLLPHTVYNDAVDAFGLEIGTEDQEFDFDGYLPADGQPVIVVLLGCETARAGQLSYETFPAQFRIAGAEVVIATLTEVLGRHASPIARRLVEELYGQQVPDAQGFGEVMLRLRRNLLADGALAVLALASFGDADWTVGA